MIYEPRHFLDRGYIVKGVTTQRKRQVRGSCHSDALDYEFNVLALWIPVTSFTKEVSPRV